MNFISTHDTTGGNSGSPVITREGEFIGLIFAGNQYEGDSYFTFSGGKARAMSVHIKAILEVLEKIYEAKALLQELSIGKNHE